MAESTGAQELKEENKISRVYTLLGRKPCNLGIQLDVQHGQQHHRLQLHSIGRSFYHRLLAISVLSGLH